MTFAAALKNPALLTSHWITSTQEGGGSLDETSTRGTEPADSTLAEDTSTRGTEPADSTLAEDQEVR